MDKYLNKITAGNCVDIMKDLPGESIDLVVTSPPYDNLREYQGYTFDFEAIALRLSQVIKPGGVIVWVVGDATINGSETGTSFKQALIFMELGLNLHDTMIWDKGSFTATGSLAVRYASVFEYMFIFTKGKLTTFNPIKDKLNKYSGSKLHGPIRTKDGKTDRRVTGDRKKIIKQYGQRHNIWSMPNPGIAGTIHPATFPEKLARDHILSWSNPSDTVLDPMCGSGTTCKMAKEHGRQFIGFDISEEYCEIARKRIAGANVPLFTID